MKTIKALVTNKTMGYTKGMNYEYRISQQCKSILFIKNDNSDSVVVNKYEFGGVNE